MIRASMVWAMAKTETRLARRLVRYWIFVVLAALLASANIVQFFFIHRMFSWGSASAAMTNPRYFVANFGANFVLVFLIGIVFLGFDLRARDKRERIVEVLDAVPCSNLELLLGRFTGLLLAAWIPVLVVTGLVTLVMYLLGTPPQPHSLLLLVVWMTLPAYAFAIGLVFLVTLLVRYRLLAFLVSTALIILVFVVSLWFIPFYMVPFTDVTGGYDRIWPSDLTPGVITFSGILQRLGYVLAGLGFLVGAAAIHPRNDDGSRAGRGAVALALVAAAVGLCAWPVLQTRATMQRRDAWRAAHEARAGEPVPDLLQVAGDVSIDPGRSIELQLELVLRAPEDQALDAALFTFNPGLAVASVQGAGGEALQFDHQDGILDVRLAAPLGPGQETSLRLEASGVPDGSFAYLDAAIEMTELAPAKAQIIVLGFNEIEFEKGYVALLPGLRWLPLSGTEAGRSAAPTDYFEVDLTVDLPQGWLAAGPGRRQEAAASDAGGARFRFAPPAPMPGVAIVASEFESYAVEVSGVTLEMLINRAHADNVEFFDDAALEIRGWLSERLEDAASMGFEYPYDALTMVEVPNSLRGYGGGWRMDSTLIQPAVILVRESGFPTAYFEGGRRNFDRAKDQEGGVPRAKRQALEAFFENDLNGGNPFIATARSFFGFQTAGVGAEGVPLDYVWETLTSELVTERTGFFSVHFFDQSFGQSFAAAGQAMNDENRISDNYTDVLVHRITSTNEVWDTVTGVSLSELDPREDPERAINVLSLKGGAMAESMLDDLGREKTGQFLAALRSRGAGTTYDREDVIAAGAEIDEDLAEWLTLWVDETDLPGFRLGNVSYHRLPDDDGGTPQYQLLVTLLNPERPAGLLRLQYRLESEDGPSGRQAAESVKIPGQSALELGLVTSRPLRSARVVPYLALNRDPFNIPLPSLDEERIVEAEPFTGGRELEWTAEDDGAIVVDDLDDGFAVDEGDGRAMLRVAGRGSDEDLDQGLPTVDRRVDPPRWSRVTYADAYGRYRRTMAVVRGGEGRRAATFSATLPRSGQWELEYFVPGWRTRRSDFGRGTWSLVLEDSSGSRDVEFDAEAAETGWQSLGRFEMASGEVLVRVSDATEGDYVQADAIRWKPVAGGPGDELAPASGTSRK